MTNVAAKTWSLSPASDGRLYSYPEGHSPTEGDIFHNVEHSLFLGPFGAPPTPVPWFYDNCAGLTSATLVGQAGTVGGAWESGAGSEQSFGQPVLPDPCGVHTAGIFCNFDSTNGSTSDTASACKNRAKFEGKWYMDWYEQCKFIPSNPEGITRNWKLFRVYPTIEDGQGEICFTNQAGANADSTNLNPVGDPGSARIWRNTADQAPSWAEPPYIPGDYGYNGKGVLNPFNDGEWLHLRCYWDIPDPMTDTNTRIVYTVQREGEPENILWDTVWVNASSDATKKSQWPDNIRLGHYWARDNDPSYNFGANTGARVYLATPMILQGWARVEIGNNADYAACTVREVQQVTAWTNTQIDFVVNQGRLPAGPVWVFVIDNSGNIIQTYPVTMGAA